MGNDDFKKFRPDGRSLALKTIQNKIEQLISSGLYMDLKDFIADNPNLGTFQNHTKLSNMLLRVWGYQITEADYLIILQELQKNEITKHTERQTTIETIASEQPKDIHTEHTNIATSSNSRITETIESSLPVENQHSRQITIRDTDNIQRSVVPEELSFGISNNYDINAQKKVQTDINKPKQKTLQMHKQAGFSSTLILSFITGLFLGIIFLNTCIKAILP